jgi:hypothetical protein
MKQSNITYRLTKRDPSYPGSLEKKASNMLSFPQATRISRNNALLNLFGRWCAFMILLLASVQAQNFNNTGGAYSGTGLFRVKSQAIGLPDTVTGTFEYFGADTQRVTAKNFEHLLLTGNGSTKQTLANVNIINSVAVADGVKFQVVSSTMTLEKITGRITNENGLISGRITKSVDLNASSDSTDFGGIGLLIRSRGSIMGTTNVVRMSGSSVASSNGNRSIQRWYEMNPANTSGTDGNLYFRYSKDELAGNDSLLLEMWRSPDNGITWRRQHTSRNGNMLLRTGKYLNASWTAAASNNLIGPANYEFDPDSILALSTDSLKGKFNTVLDSLFVAQITDVFGNPIADIQVRFGITEAPLSASGQILSNTLVTTDSLGKVSTQLRLGDKTGRYTVTAQVESVPTTQIVFYGYAGSGVNSLRPNVAPNQDSIKQVVGPFIVDALDEANSGVAHTGIEFRVIPPAGSGAIRQMFLSADTMTDGSGRAQAMLQLGEKIGIYTVEARSIENGTLVASFTVRATHGFPALAWKDNIIRQDSIHALMPEFTYAITDGDTNAVPGRTVRFALMQPDSSIADSAFVLTDSLGQAKAASFRYGNIAGTYTVSAQDMNLAGSKRFFTCTAFRGAARMLAQYSGDAQVGQIGDRLLPFVVQVTDAGGNAVPNAIVNFSIIERTDTLAKYDSLTAQIDTTDINGRAYTALTLGDRQGRYTVRASIAGAKDTTFVAYAVMLLADVNHDNYRNIGDLTAMIDHAIGRQPLTGYDFSKADMYPKRSNGLAGDGLVDIRDVQVCLDSLLNAGWDPTHDWLNAPLLPIFKIGGAGSLTGVNAPIPLSPTDSCYILATHIGTRFVLKNSEPVKGLQIMLYLKNPTVLDTTDFIFPRAKMMIANVNTVGREVSIILWNYSNTPIEPGDSTIFRLPVQLTDSNVDSLKVIISTGVNNDVSLVGSKQIDARNMLPSTWVLYQNYPNPFNPSTTIEFDVPEITGKIPRVAVQIFNILGQKVRTIERGIHDVGRYSVKWDGVSEDGVRVASGVYFYRLLAGDYTSTKKMVMMK